MAIRGEQVDAALGYMIAEVEINDPPKLQNYTEKVEQTQAPLNHHFFIRTRKVEALRATRPRAGLW
jgi:uncharacterized protein (DUF1330 family)